MGITVKKFLREGNNLAMQGHRKAIGWAHVHVRRACGRPSITHLRQGSGKSQVLLVVQEFVNPKYADETRTSFKKSTRLECMMQDYPKSLPSTAQVYASRCDPRFALPDALQCPDFRIHTGGIHPA